MHNALRLLWTLVVVLVVASSATSLSAQDVINYRRSNWTWFDPVDDISSKIFAQAQLVRARGEFAVDIGHARLLHAKAVDQELDNWRKHVEVYWDRKIIRKQKQLELNKLKLISNQQYLNNRKAANRQLWDRISNHPELTAPAAIPTGRALNFMLDRLSGAALVHEFVKENAYNADVFTEVRLEPEQLHALQLRQLAAGATHTVFRADETEGLNLESWPYLLRGEQLKTARERFERVRDQVAKAAAAADGVVPVENLERLEEALLSLSRDFYRKHRVDEWARRGFRKYSQFRSAEAFLRSLAREVTRLQNTGDFHSLRGASAYDPHRDGDHLVGLLTYMTRNGLDFAPAAPGDEPTYNQVFQMMRDLYFVVADDDAGIQPKDLTEQFK